MKGYFKMKIQLPNGNRLTLDENITLEQKLIIVEDLTTEWHSTIQSNWDSNSVRFFLDGLANYLCWHKDEDNKNKQDKEILSVFKVEKMEGKRKASSIPFSSLSVSQKESLGLDGDKNNG
jgi:hypothetical protein